MHFAVVFSETASDAAKERLKTVYPSAYELVPGSVYLVRDTRLTTDVAEAVGIKSEPRIATGVVFKLSAFFAGFAEHRLWKWLNGEIEADASSSAPRPPDAGGDGAD